MLWKGEIKCVQFRVAMCDDPDDFSTEYIISDNFTITSNKSDEETKWRILFSLRVKSKPLVYIALKHSSGHVDFDLSCILSLVNQGNDQSEPAKVGQIFVRKNQWEDIHHLGIEDFINYNVLYNKKELYFPNGELIIQATIHIFDSTIDFVPNPVEPNDDNKKLFRTMEDADVTIKTADGNTLKAHSNILSESSEIFKEILSQKKSFEIDDQEFNSGVVKELLRFCYYGNGKLKRKKFSLELFRIAKKFFIHLLAETCMKTIYEELDEFCPIEVAKLAKEYFMHDLFFNCGLLIQVKQATIFKSEKWNMLDNEIKIMLSEAISYIDTSHPEELQLYAPKDDKKFKVKKEKIDREAIFKVPLLPPKKRGESRAAAVKAGEKWRKSGAFVKYDDVYGPRTSSQKFKKSSQEVKVEKVVKECMMITEEPEEVVMSVMSSEKSQSEKSENQVEFLETIAYHTAKLLGLDVNKKEKK